MTIVRDEEAEADSAMHHPSSDHNLGWETSQSPEHWPEDEEDSCHKSLDVDSPNNFPMDPNWRKLYEINDDPKRREFLDDLFTFMQNKGSPINRLPIMAKSVLDLYELYNLVIARGGLVDVINKKLWQEIIKGLHLPSSITSAAFTLRTQYMKYLYPYECAKKNLSTPDELQVAIDGNKREGRRSNYGAYGTNGGPGTPMHEALGHQRGAHTPNSLASHLHGQLSPLSLVTAVQQAAAAGGQHQALHNGSAAHAPLTHHPHHPQQPGMMQLPNAGIAPEMFNEFMKQLQRDFRRSVTTPSRGDSESPQPQRSSPTREQAALQFEMSRFNIWNNFYTSNVQASLGYPIQAASPPRTASRSPLVHLESPEPQREALDLGIKSSSSVSSHGQTSPNPSHASSGVAIKREMEHDSSPTALVSAKRPRRAVEPVSVPDNAEDTPHEANGGPLQPNTHIKITNRGDGNENSLVVSMELNGVTYQGVLFAQTENRSSHGLPESGGHTARRSPSSRNVVL
ncbi:protein dead ringer [Copidosoma floridanum]|uniref:protein dead ringer n=1 Tax=Copidosoma floridanum TaxID=29053 RepID=UPI0006C9C512|nr:protein dead ringer [Copidosoma floridanum]